MTSKKGFPAELQTLDKAARSGSRGVTSLFSGAAGSGKMKAAMDIASSIDAPLLKVNLKTVLSKYIGETEKNLSSIFKAAKLAGAVLFFDEADALFGKRTKVKDSHDRYANTQISYLLKRSERFAGVVIFASNQQDDIDQAVLKGATHVLKFPLGKPGCDNNS